MDDCEELLPHWLKFVKGVVDIEDSEELPLNIAEQNPASDQEDFSQKMLRNVCGER